MVISFHVFTWKGAIDHIGINNASTTFSFWLPKEFQLNHVVFWIVPFSFLEKTGLGLVKLLMHTKKEQAHRIHRKVNDFRWANWCALCRSHARCSISCISYFVSCVLILVHHDFLWAHVPYLFFSPVPAWRIVTLMAPLRAKRERYSPELGTATGAANRQPQMIGSEVLYSMMVSRCAAIGITKS